MTRPHASTTMSDNGSAPDAAVCLYIGKMMHHRMKPVAHRFSYTVFSVMVDLDRLKDADASSRLFTINRPGLVSFYEADHLEGNHASLRAQLDAQLLGAGLKERAKRIVLVCYPRILGFVFNPLSVYYAYDHEDRLSALVYEVRNTFGGRHTYVCPIRNGEASEAGISQSAIKKFHVSPFLEMEMRYFFRMLPPGKSIRWRILANDAAGPKLAATFHGDVSPLTSASLLAVLAKIPLMTLKVYLTIHWEALRLKLKGVPFFGMKPHQSGIELPTESAIADSGKSINLSDVAT